MGRAWMGSRSSCAPRPSLIDWPPGALLSYRAKISCVTIRFRACLAGPSTSTAVRPTIRFQGITSAPAPMAVYSMFLTPSNVCVALTTIRTTGTAAGDRCSVAAITLSRRIVLPVYRSCSHKTIHPPWPSRSSGGSYDREEHHWREQQWRSCGGLRSGDQSERQRHRHS